MDLERGCLYCSNLSHDKAMEKFDCKVFPRRVLEHAGACMLAVVGNDRIIIEDCNGFEDKNKPKE